MALESNEPLSKTGDLSLDSADPAVSAGETVNADPMTGEPGAHPTAVGIGAIAAGAAGAAAIGMFAGPVGAMIGAAIGAVAGGLAGHEVAVANDATSNVPTGDLNAEANGSVTEASGRPSSVTTQPEENLTIFPGLDMGAPVVTLEREDAGDPAANRVSPDTAAVPVGRGTPSAMTPEETEDFASDADSMLVGRTPSMTTEEPQDFAVGGEPTGAFTIGADPLEAIRVAAYYRYLHRLEDGRPVDALEDWYEAEREVYRF